VNNIVLKYMHSVQKWLCISILLAGSMVQAQNITEYESKGAYLLNFYRYVTWPTPDNTLQIGVIGNDDFVVLLEKIAKEINLANINKSVHKVSLSDDLAQFQLIFVSNIKPDELEKLLKQLENKDILTVGDNIDNFCEMGGIINFSPKGSEKRFEINNPAALKAGLKISSKLLTLAKLTVTDTGKLNIKN